MFPSRSEGVPGKISAAIFGPNVFETRFGEDRSPNSCVPLSSATGDDRGRSDFGALQSRLGVGKRDAAQVARKHPAVLLCFDVLTLAGSDLTTLPLVERRERLEDLVADLHPYLQLVTQTDDWELAEQWLTSPASVEGVVAKRADGRYSAGRNRAWIKVKRKRTVDCVVVGIAGDIRSPRLVLALRHKDGELHHLGVSHPLHPDLVRHAAHVFAEAGPSERPIGSRWGRDAVPEWRRVPPTLVCEVAYTLLGAGRWFRSPATVLRWRPDRSAGDCLLDQLSAR